MHLTAVIVVFLVAFVHAPAAAWAETIHSGHAMAMHGEPKYPPNFRHFDYVNPGAPKGGTLRLGVTGRPTFGTLIALVRRGEPVVGVIEMSALGERWVGAEGQATTFNGQPARARACPELADAWLYATTPEMFVGADAEAFRRLRLRSRAAIYGADCYAYGLLASGTVDLVCEASMQPYDYCAVVPVIRGAGGVATDWHGKPLGLESDGRVLAAGDATAHAAALAALTG